MVVKWVHGCSRGMREATDLLVAQGFVCAGHEATPSSDRSVTPGCHGLAAGQPPSVPSLRTIGAIDFQGLRGGTFAKVGQVAFENYRLTAQR